MSSPDITQHGEGDFLYRPLDYSVIGFTIKTSY